MKTKSPINPPFQKKSYINVIVKAFRHFVFEVPNKSNNSKICGNTFLHYWMVKFGPRIYHVTDYGSEYAYTDMAYLCTLMDIRHSLMTSHSPWTNEHVAVQNNNLCRHIRMFLQNTLRSGHNKLICTLLHIIHNLFQH